MCSEDVELVTDDGLEEGGLGGGTRRGADALEPKPIEGVSGNRDGERDTGPIGESLGAARKLVYMDVVVKG